MSSTRARLDALSPEQRSRLEQALLARRVRAQVEPITPRGRAQAVLSSSQQRLWFLDRLAPGSPTYNAVVACWLTGPLDPALLELAFVRMVTRHEVLRSVIELPPAAEDPVQRPLDDWILTMGRHRVEGPDAALDLARDLARAPYDLAHDLPLRLDLVEVGDHQWLLVVGEHHIAFDGWSDEIMFAEVSAEYAALRSGDEPAALPPLAVQYADYATWEQARLRAGALEDHVRYWRRALAGAPAVTRLPLDRPRPTVQAFDGRHLALRLDHADAVRQLGSRTGGTDFMVLVAAWAATLYTWSGETDLVLGTPMANRNRVELEPLVGFFSNTVPLRVRLDPNAGFADLVAHVRSVALEGFDHQELPFEQVVEAVAPERVPGANPLFSVNVRVAGGSPPLPDLPGVRAAPASVDLGFSRFDLAIEMQVGPVSIAGYLEYNEALLDRASAEGLVRRLDLLLGAVLADPQLPLWKIPQPEMTARRRSARRSAVPASSTLARRRVSARVPADHPVVEVHWLDLSPAGPVAGRDDLAILSAQERQRASRFLHDRDRERFVRRRALLRRLLADRLARDARDLVLTSDDYGRPLLADGHGDLRFNASSSGDLGLVALSTLDVGVDIEIVAPDAADLDVARRLFASEEVAALDHAPADDVARLFFNCWTRKEAYVKATGRGLSFPLEAFAVEIGDHPEPRLLRSTLRPHDLGTWAIRSLQAPTPPGGGSTAAALVVPHADPQLSIHPDSRS